MAVSRNSPKNYRGQYKNSSIGAIVAGGNTTITHNLGGYDLIIELMYAPVSGSHAGKFINAEGVLAWETIDSNSLKIYNDGVTTISNGAARITIFKF